MIKPATLSFTADGTPYSAAYGDVYHAAAGGLAQARHVFLAGNGLPERWRGRERLVIVETGFGLGLNFLATWQAWQADPARCRRLHFVSLERAPFALADLRRLHAVWPELAPFAAELAAAWPPLVAGLHRLSFAGGRVVLDLVLGDAAAALPQLDLAADAFYLDGFAPAKNPDIWSAPLLTALATLAAPGARLATWSVAREVRAALAASGWRLEKAPGFAGKRQMLCGSLEGGGLECDALEPQMATNDKRAIVIGAGLAGSSVANRLAARGYAVQVIDALAGPGEGASGNRAGVLRSLPSRDDNLLARLSRAAFLTTRRHLVALDAAGAANLWQPCGVLHLARDATHAATQQQIVAEQMTPADYLSFVDRQRAAELAGWPVAGGGWWFAGGAWVAPRAYCAANLRQFAGEADGETSGEMGGKTGGAAESGSITCRFSTFVDRIAHQDGCWQVFDAAGACLASAPQLVVANANDCRRLLGDWLPIHPGRGQVSHLPAAAGSPPGCVVCRLGYVTPAIAGERYAGATFMLRDHDPALRLADQRENLAKLDFILPGFSQDQALDAAALGGRVGFRPMSPDRLPAIGAVPQLHDAAPPPGLWMANGFGARGIVWSALAGELIADAICRTPSILPRDLVKAVAPARYLARQKRRHS